MQSGVKWFFYAIEEIRCVRQSVAVITPSQCRAARGLLGWSQQDLATQAGVGIVTVHQLEAGTTQPRRATLEVIRRAFENAGVDFIEENGGGPGLRLRKLGREKLRK